MKSSSILRRAVASLGSIVIGGALCALPGAAAAADFQDLLAASAKAATARMLQQNGFRGAGAQQAPALPRGGFEGCLAFFPAAQPPSVPPSAAGKTRPLCFDAFAVLHSGESRSPVYVVERLTREQLLDAQDEERTNRFFADARLPGSDRASLEDYAGSGFDRGHMAPAGDMPTAQAMAQSFSLANMVPQDPTNNRKVWSKIESDTRHYVRRTSGPVYVFTGPFYGQRPAQTTRNGQGRVWIPTHLYKLVYDAQTQRAWAHWVENSATARIGRPIPYRELVHRVGIEFLAGVPLAEH